MGTERGLNGGALGEARNATLAVSLAFLGPLPPKGWRGRSGSGSSQRPGEIPGEGGEGSRNLPEALPWEAVVRFGRQRENFGGKVRDVSRALGKSQSAAGKIFGQK